MCVCMYSEKVIEKQNNVSCYFYIFRCILMSFLSVFEYNYWVNVKINIINKFG